MKPTLLCAALATLLLAGCNKAAAPAPGSTAMAPGGAGSPDSVVATYDNQRITLSELDSSLIQEFYTLRQKALESMILERLVGAEAKKAGKTEEELLKGIAEKAAPVSDERVKAIYDEHKEAFGGRSFEEVKPMIQAQESRQARQEAIVAYFDDLKQKANVKIMLPEPRVNVAATGPSKGPQGAPVTIIEFSDFQCPFCSQARKSADQAVNNYSGKVRLVFRDFPLPFHDKAEKAAEAGHCAEEQGKFWEMHDRMFDSQDKLSPEDLKASAKAIGLDTAKFDACLDSGRTADKVKQDIAAAKAAGVTGTPAFFVNGRSLPGVQPYEKLKQVIDEELSQK
jgi:protein-disulfide isomerase